MYRFVSSIKPNVLEKAYLKMYDVKQLQTKFDDLMSAYPDIKAVLPKDISAKKLLVGNFKYLTKVYCAFTGYLKGKPTNEGKSIRKAFEINGFNYKKYADDIADFLMDSSNGFEIYNCFYCDLVSVSTFNNTKGKRVRSFETEHVLDKGKCPLVAMSLYNFVPSCRICNGLLKSTKTIGDTEKEISKLSPTAEGYDFENKVTFIVNPLRGDFDNLKATNHVDDYDIDFNVSETMYQKTIDLFNLKQRYNINQEKVELLMWFDIRNSNPDKKVKELADLEGISFDKKFEEIFRLDAGRRYHFKKEKARRDIILNGKKDGFLVLECTT